MNLTIETRRKCQFFDFGKRLPFFFWTQIADLFPVFWVLVLGADGDEGVAHVLYVVVHTYVFYIPENENRPR